MPGLRALNTRGGAGVSSVSCGSAGNCAAGGQYQDRHGQQGFVAVERNGRWGTATGVPGLAGLNQGGYADVSAVSCGSAGSCAAGGEYTDADSQDFYGFVAVERDGVWSKAVTVPASADGYVTSVSCASACNCLAGGSDGAIYTSNFNAFFVEERAGHWGHRRPVPGLRTLKHIDSEISAVACPSAGNCAAGGDYEDPSGNLQVFVAVERNGTWGTATGVPGLAALNTGGEADVNSVSCGSPGDCAAGGHYTDRSHHRQGFVAVERDGAWGTATGVPGLGALNKRGNADVNSVSCGSAGNCAAGGYYKDSDGHYQGFVAGEQNGRWGTAIRVPGLAALNKARGRQGHLGVVRLGGQLRGRRVLHRPLPSPPGVRGHRAERRVGHGDRGARPQSPERGRGRRGRFAVMPLPGPLRRRRVLPRPFRSPPGVRHPAQIAPPWACWLHAGSQQPCTDRHAAAGDDGRPGTRG